jgi:hypothetical protein
MLYLLVAHRLPFSGKTPRELASRHLNEHPKPPIEINPTISSDLNTIILRALEKEPGKRFQTAADFRDALRILISPRQDQLYLEQAQEEFELTAKRGLLRRKTHLDNARKLTELALGENPGLQEASDLLAQVQKSLVQHRRHQIAFSVMGGGAVLTFAAGAASYLVKAPGTLDVMVVKPVDVVVDGERLGTAPGRFQVSTGKHRLVYSIPGVIDFPKGGKEIVIQENKVFEETPIVPNIAEVLIVSSQHLGAQIKVDGIVQTTRVPSKCSLLYGEHKIEVGGIQKSVMVDQDSLKVEFY